ncbi:UNVERIFIED_CONTAM: hypothetical protein O8I53_07690 [Campylobacter lari]
MKTKPHACPSATIYPVAKANLVEKTPGVELLIVKILEIVSSEIVL